MDNIRIDGHRLWESLMAMARHGADDQGRGVPPGAHRRGQGGQGRIRLLVRGRRLHGFRRPDGQHLRPPGGAGQCVATGDDRQPPGQPAHVVVSSTAPTESWRGWR